MKKQSLGDRAARYASKQRFASVVQQAVALSGWLAGYQAAKSDFYASTYSRKFCGHCAQPKDGHKHTFCKKCKRIKEHCECNYTKKDYGIE